MTEGTAYVHRWAGIAMLLAATAATGAAGAGRTSLVHDFATGFDASDAPLLIPAIDPAGVTYHPPSGHLFVVDSEIDEVGAAFSLIGANVFEISPRGDVLYGAWSLRESLPRNSEPTGIAYNPLDGHFYVTNDSRNRVYRYAFSAETGFVTDAVLRHTAHNAGSHDPEGITVDPETGVLYIVDGSDSFVWTLTYDPRRGFVVGDRLDLAALNGPDEVPQDAEGIGFDPESGHLFLVSAPDDALFEFTTGGVFVTRYPLSELGHERISPQGLAFGPAPGRLGARRTVLFMVDAGVDNNDDPLERDGRVSVVEVNHPPRLAPIGDWLVEEGETVRFSASAIDADAQDTHLFSLVGAVPVGAAIDPVTGRFTWTPTETQGAGGYLLTVRVTDDGTPPAHDEETIHVSVLEVNEAPVLGPVPPRLATPGSHVMFTARATDPDRMPALAGGLVAYWPFDTGLDVARSATGVFDGALQRGARIAREPGEFRLGGGALRLDGRDGRVRFGTTHLPGDFTVAAWLRPENIGRGRESPAVLLGDGRNASWIGLQERAVRVSINGIRKTLYTRPDFVNGPWQHFALVRRDGVLTVYRDGVVVDTGGVLRGTFSPGWIGQKKPKTMRYAGHVDDLAIWTRALDESRIGLLAGVEGGAARAVDDAGAVDLNTLRFAVTGDVPADASIDEASGRFAWTAPASPRTRTIILRVCDDGAPSAYDTETITLRGLDEVPRAATD